MELHKWVKDDTIKVKLERGQKGTYAWEITYEHLEDTILLERIAKIDKELREQYASEQE